MLRSADAATSWSDESAEGCSPKRGRLTIIGRRNFHAAEQTTRPSRAPSIESIQTSEALHSKRPPVAPSQLSPLLLLITSFLIRQDSIKPADIPPVYKYHDRNCKHADSLRDHYS